MKHWGIWGVLAALLLVLSPGSAWSQASNSTVRGTVTDASQAVIPGTTVTLTNTATNVARSVETNEAGLYVFPGTNPGPYRITAESAGMQRYEATLTVQVQQDPTIDITLQVGETTTTVEVIDVTPLVRTDSPALGQSLERQRIEQLPVNGRGYQNLLQAVPGVQSQSHGHGIGGRMRGNGLASGSNQLIVDGAAQNEVWEGWDVARTPSLDAVEEIRVEVNNSSAKFSRPTSVILSTKSGSNEFHGTVFYTNRNSGYGVARRRQDAYDKPPYLNRNEYGVSVGGPIVQNRTFFFANWESTRYVRGATVQAAVPTAAMRAGDFRGLVDSQGRQTNIYDPMTTDPNTYERQQFAYQGVPNTIDPARISPVAQFIFNHYQLPNRPNVNPLVDDNFFGPFSRLLDQHTYNLRIDHRFSDKNLLNGRYAYNQHDETYGNSGAIFLPIDGFRTINTTTRTWPSHNLNATWIHIFDPTLTNEVLISGLRDWHYRGAGLNEINYSESLGLPNPFSANNWPTFSSMGVGGDVGGEAPFFMVSHFVTAQDNATKTYGKHEFQFGFQYRWEEVPKSIISTSGGFSADTDATSLYDPESSSDNPQTVPFTGNNLANFYLGVLNYNSTFRRPWAFLRRQEYAPYIQDTWKVTQRLTLNLGLRYEVRTPLQDKNGLTTSFDLERKAYVLGTDMETFIGRGATLPSILQAVEDFGGSVVTHDEVGLPSPLANTQWGNIGPRIGFAYRAFDGAGAMVIRGGYRKSFYTQPITNWFSSQNNQALVSASFPYTVSNTALSPDGLPEYGLRSRPQYIAGVNTPSSIIDISEASTIARGLAAVRINPDINDPYVHDWNLTIEKEVMQNTIVRVGYVGNYSGGMMQTIRHNEATPTYIWQATTGTNNPTGEFANVAKRPYDQTTYGSVNELVDTGFARWNGFQAELERRYSKGFGFQIFYVTGNTLSATGNIDPVNTFLPGAVPTDFDDRNRFLNYRRDTNTPQHQLRWNWVLDLPFGRGKLLGGNAGGALEKVIGGWQIAGIGNLQSSHWTLPTGNYPTSAPVEIYGEKYPVQDCRSGACFPGFLYWNGYIPANQINSVDEDGNPNGIMGVPENYQPAVAPLIPWGTTQLPANAPANTNLTQFWDTNNVWLRMANGNAQRTTFNDNLHPYRNQYNRGPNQWFMDASLFKNMNLTERVAMRFTVDFFNVFNNPNNPTSPEDNGILDTRDSGSDARTTQLGIRLTF